MKIIIFAGGGGKRFWPITREKSPKQFVKIINKHSTLEDTIDRFQPVYGWYSMYISTNERYISLIKKQYSHISISNIFSEPARRDVGPAVGLALMRLKKLGVSEPIAIIWSDHLIKDHSVFQKKLRLAEETILKKEAQIVFMGEKPTYANEHLGWISVSAKSSGELYNLEGFEYKPTKKTCEKLFKSGKCIWNTGYFVSTVDYLLSLYKKYNPELYKQLCEIEKALNTSNEASVIEKVYPKISPISFDHAVIYHIDHKDAKVIQTEMGWQDPGTLYALKQYLSPGKTNAIRGNVKDFHCEDCMIYNFEDEKLIAGLHLDGMIIVNTKDAIIVVHKDHVKDLTEMLESFKGSSYEKYL